jgi:hypothetical protein
MAFSTTIDPLGSAEVKIPAAQSTPQKAAVRVVADLLTKIVKADAWPSAAAFVETASRPRSEDLQIREANKGIC